MSLNETLNQYQTPPLSVGQEAGDTVYSKDDMFQKNLNDLLNNISCKSENKKKLLKQALHEIASTPQGRDIVSRLPRGMKIKILPFTVVLNAPLYWVVLGTYSWRNKTISLKASCIKENPSKIKGKDFKSVLLHELRHANQHALEGRDKDFFGRMTIVENFKANKLSEAETHAWVQTNLLCERIFGHWSNISKDKINAFLKRDLIGEKKKIFGILSNPFFNENKVRQTPVYQFQQALRHNNGNVYVSQKYLVGYYMTYLMQDNVGLKDKLWQIFYHWQAFQAARFYPRLTIDKKVQPNSDYEKILDRYQSEYGVQHQDIDRIGLGYFGIKYLNHIQKSWDLYEKKVEQEIEISLKRKISNIQELAQFKNQFDENPLQLSQLKKIRSYSDPMSFRAQMNRNKTKD